MNLSRAIALGLANLVIASAILPTPGSAQDRSPNRTQDRPQPAVLSLFTSSDCQISLRARQQATAATQLVDDAPAKVDAQADTKLARTLHLALANPQSSTVIATELTVHGYSSQVRVSPAALIDADADLSKTVTLSIRIDPDRNVVTDLRLPGFTTVSRIDIDSVTFEDGKIWHSSPTRACHVAPDLLMLIGGR